MISSNQLALSLKEIRLIITLALLFAFSYEFQYLIWECLRNYLLKHLGKRICCRLPTTCNLYVQFTFSYKHVYCIGWARNNYVSNIALFSMSESLLLHNYIHKVSQMSNAGLDYRCTRKASGMCDYGIFEVLSHYRFLRKLVRQHIRQRKIISS